MFYLFDYCRNQEYFSQEPPSSGGSLSESLRAKLFNARLELIGVLETRPAMVKEVKSGYVAECETVVPQADEDDFDPKSKRLVQRQVTRRLYTQFASMNFENFVVRTHRPVVEKFAKAEAWAKPSDTDKDELAHQIAGLPTQLDRESEDAKRFDLLVLNLQLALSSREPFYERSKKQVVAIAGLLEEKSTISKVRKQMSYIQVVQTDPWWEDVTVPMLEVIRRRLRDLVQFIEKKKRQPIYTDFEDLLGDETEVGFRQFAGQDTFERLRSEAQASLREHFDIDAVRKLWTSEPLAQHDLNDLESILNDNQIGNPEYVEQAKQECESFGLFVRSLVGLDREVARRLFGEFLQGSEYNANQIELINMVINHLVDHGVVGVSILYESPFTDVSPQGPDAIFSAEQIDKITQLLEEIRSTAVAA
ncbi:type I restriction-modification enzyme R subunit C-terminal domain-containing protein [Novipirellula herctigrandis]|uniref:type I restriction-modification enzyme R subunit C-terminal domain-containing protein n=1 Tax=Novipirellula herctigrandis TaxID=2527986 RepID=UPI003AF39EBE